MKQIVILFFLILCFCFQLHGQLAFQNITAGNDDFFFSAIDREDGGYLSFGYTNRFGAGDFDFYLVNMDEEGNVIWSKSYGGLNSDLGYSIAKTQDDGYVLLGGSQSFGAGGSDILLMKIDMSGEVVWSKTYGGNGWDVGYELTLTNDGGYIIVGRTNSFGSGDGDIYCIKLDSFGEVIWNQTYGGVNNEDGQQIKQTSDNGFIVIGHTQSFGAGNADIYLIKTDNSGVIEWTKTYGGLNYDYGNSVQQTIDGGYIISGHTNSFGYDNGETLLIKTDNLGNIIWSKTFGGSEVDYSHYVIQNPSGGYTFTGQTNSFGEGKFDAFIVETNSLGTPVWAMSYGGLEDDFSNAIVHIPSQEGYIIAGNTWSYGNQSRAYLIKTDSIGISGCNESQIILNTGSPAILVGTGGLANSGIDTSNVVVVVVDVNSIPQNNALLCTSTNIIEQKEVFDYEVFPNPFKDYAILKTNYINLSQATFLLYNLNGEVVHKEDTFLSNRIEIKRNNLSSGMYIFKLISENNRVVTGKILIQ